VIRSGLLEEADRVNEWMISKKVSTQKGIRNVATFKVAEHKF